MYMYVKLNDYAVKKKNRKTSNIVWVDFNGRWDGPMTVVNGKCGHVNLTYVYTPPPTTHMMLELQQKKRLSKKSFPKESIIDSAF